MPENYLIETPVWIASIYQLETDDVVLGGPTGIDNRQPRELANRTAWLKAQIEAFVNNLAAHEASNNHPLATTAAKGMVILSTLAEAQAGLANGKAITPDVLKAIVDAAINSLIDASPGTLDTLNELAAALGDDADFAATMTTALAAKAPLASPALTGVPTAPTAAPGTSTTQVASTAFVQQELANQAGPDLGYLANLDIGEGLEEGPAGFLRAKLADQSLRRSAGGLRISKPVLAVTADQIIAAAQNGHYYVALSSFSATLGQVAALWPGFSIEFNALAGDVTFVPAAGEAINGGTAGAALSVPRGSSGVIVCDGIGWYVNTTPLMIEYDLSSSLDIGPVATCAAGGTQIGAAFSAFIPPQGTIDILLDQVAMNTTDASWGLGINIAGVPYFSQSSDGNGSAGYAPAIYFSGTSATPILRGGFARTYSSFTCSGSLGVSFDIGRINCARGLQTAYLIFGNAALNSTYPGPIIHKGTVAPLVGIARITPKP